MTFFFMLFPVIYGISPKWTAQSLLVPPCSHVLGGPGYNAAMSACEKSLRWQIVLRLLCLDAGWLWYAASGLNQYWTSKNGGIENSQIWPSRNTVLDWLIQRTVCLNMRQFVQEKKWVGHALKKNEEFWKKQKGSTVSNRHWEWTSEKGRDGRSTLRCIKHGNGTSPSSYRFH